MSRFVKHLLQEAAIAVPERVVTYSPAYTLVPTYECFNRCSYCNFREDIGASGWLSRPEAERRLRTLSPGSVTEILILSGEVHPDSPRRADWLQLLVDLCELSLELGFLPHTNAGPLSRSEMARLQVCNVSMGLMLEQLTPRLLQTVHRQAPSKEPQLRLAQLEQAGELGIPFTTGLLLGLGETAAERRETLEAIAAVHRRHSHIQEVILQPHSPGGRQADTLSPFPLEDLPEWVAIARRILPEDVVIQIPANLVAKPDLLLACLEAGARDLGGIGPRDEVNPDYDFPGVADLEAWLGQHGWALRARLPTHETRQELLPPGLKAAVNRNQAASTVSRTTSGRSSVSG